MIVTLVALLSKVLPYLALAGVGVAAFFGYTAKVKNDERKKQRTEVALANASAVMARADVARTTAAASDSDMRDELRHDERPPAA